MTQEQKHTALPYKLKHVNTKMGDTVYVIRGAHNEFAGGSLVAAMECGKDNKAETAATAEFIVRACNSHYELLAIAQKSLQEREASFSIERFGTYEKWERWLKKYYPKRYVQKKEIEAAIAKAEVK